MKNLFKIVITVPLIVIFAFIGICISADEALVVENITPGTIASSAKMNARFEAIETVINQNLVTMYDYGSPVNTTRVFVHSNSPTALTVITYEENREIWVHSDTANNWRKIYLTASSPNGTMEVGRKVYDASNTMTHDLTYDPPFLGIDLSNPKEIGKVWGGVYVAKKSDGSIYGVEGKTFTILAIETVTVPAGTFENCIKVYVDNSYKEVVWFAEGFGMIKMISVVNGLMEMK